MNRPRLRVALLTPTALVDGGVAVHVQRSAEALRKAGHDVLLVTGDDTAADADVQIPGLGTHPLTAPQRLELVRALRKLEVEVAHLHDVDDADVVNDIRAIAATLVSAHGWSGCGPGTRFFGHGRECQRAHGPLCIPNMLLRNCKHTNDPRGVLAYYRRAADRLRALRCAHVAVAHSSAMSDHLANNDVRGVRSVPLPVDPPAREPGEPTGAARVAFAGRLTQVKGVDVLLRSARHFEAHIDICGAGFDRARLGHLTTRLNLTERVTFHGWRSTEEVYSVYTNAHVVAVPSVYPEPFGMVGPEALVRRRPVVASSTGGIGDWLQHGLTGLAVEPGDPRALGGAIASLLADTGTAARMAGAGRQLVLERFSETVHVNALLAAYREAINQAEIRCSVRSLRSSQQSASP